MIRETAGDNFTRVGSPGRYDCSWTAYPHAYSFQTERPLDWPARGSYLEEDKRRDPVCESGSTPCDLRVSHKTLSASIKDPLREADCSDLRTPLPYLLKSFVNGRPEPGTRVFSVYRTL